MLSVSKIHNNEEDAKLPTHKWTSSGNLESSDGICPLIELLFMWLLKGGKRKKKYEMNFIYTRI